MIAEWNTLPETLQLHVAQQAFRQAVDTIASQADVLAGEFEAGTLSDRGGADALKLLATIVRALRPADEAVAGRA